MTDLARLLGLLITSVTKVLCIFIPCSCFLGCVWIVMNHAAEFAGRSSTVKVDVAIALSLGISVAAAGTLYGIHQRNLRRQLQKAHQTELEGLQNLVKSLTIGAKVATKKGRT